MNTTSRHLDPLARKSTPSIIADKLRAAIGDGDIPAGSQLFEAELARTLGVSRGPLREGLQRLTQEGLLVSVRNRGVFVIEMTPENVSDMYTVRGAVERAAIQRIVRQDPAGAGNALQSIVDQMAAAEDVPARSELDIAFHEKLVAWSQSPRLQRVHRTLITETRMCIHALTTSYVSRDDRVAEHREITDAIVDADADRADKLMIAHMDDALQRLTR